MARAGRIAWAWLLLVDGPITTDTTEHTMYYAGMITFAFGLVKRSRCGRQDQGRGGKLGWGWFLEEASLKGLNAHAGLPSFLRCL